MELLKRQRRRRRRSSRAPLETHYKISMPFPPAAALAIAVRLLLFPLKLPEAASGSFFLNILILLLIQEPLLIETKPCQKPPDQPLM
jgi:hypothetical protein